MPGGKEFTDSEHRYIVAARVAGKTFQKIAEELHCTTDSIRKMLRRDIPKRKSGRPSKLSMGNKRRITRIASNPEKSSNQIKVESGVDVSASTIRRVLRTRFHIKKQKTVRAQRLERHLSQSRFKFAEANLQTDWSEVRFPLSQ